MYIMMCTNELITPSRVPCPPANTERFGTGPGLITTHFLTVEFNFLMGTDENRQYVASIVLVSMFILQLQ